MEYELEAQVKCSTICSKVEYVVVSGVDTAKRDLKMQAIPPPRPEHLGECRREYPDAVSKLRRRGGKRTDTHSVQSCPWVGLIRGLGGLGWVENFQIPEGWVGLGPSVRG